ncbi:MAG: AAA family ATPase [Bacteroidia bacterium]
MASQETIVQDVEQQLHLAMPVNATEDQALFFETFAQFITCKQHNPLMLLRGYAGTGKTTTLKAIISTLQKYNVPIVLMAPTGRAAKVMTTYTNKHASTLHRRMYKFKAIAGGQRKLTLMPNMLTNALFVVDESSMISTQLVGDQDNSLLDDLLSYVYNGTACRVLLMGDVAQLPPVGETQANALDEEYIQAIHSCTLYSAELRQVVRQRADSGILYNATLLRMQLMQYVYGSTLQPKFELAGYKDIVQLEGDAIVEAVESAYSKDGIDSTIIICRSNKRAYLFNQNIRVQVLQLEDEITVGDYIMIAKNNYYWLPEDSAVDFIANGDTARITRIHRYMEVYGMRFCKASIELVDYDAMGAIDVWFMLDTLAMEQPSMSSAQSTAFYNAVAEDYADEPNKAKRTALIKNNEFYNALQVKFNYAVTCHKAQGGQWQHVFIDQGYLTQDMLTEDFAKWLYTALTRSTHKVYLINFNADFIA